MTFTHEVNCCVDAAKIERVETNNSTGRSEVVNKGREKNYATEAQRKASKEGNFFQKNKEEQEVRYVTLGVNRL